MDFFGKVLFDRDAKDFYSDWQSLAKEMKIDDNAKIKDLAQWVKEEADGKKKFNEAVETVDLFDTLPGQKPGDKAEFDRIEKEKKERKEREAAAKK